MFIKIKYKIVCGEGGIRTRDTLLRYTRFPGVPLQPLEHLSFVFSNFFETANVKKYSLVSQFTM